MKLSYSPIELERWIRLVSEEFYKAVYDDHWLKQVFQIPREHITSQQIDFMLGALGGPKRYSGRSPGDAHTHIFINEEMWNVREEILKEAFNKVQCPEDLRLQWLKIENAFKKIIVLDDPSKCEKRFYTDEIIYVPRNFNKAS